MLTVTAGRKVRFKTPVKTTGQLEDESIFQNKLRKYSKCTKKESLANKEQPNKRCLTLSIQTILGNKVNVVYKTKPKMSKLYQTLFFLNRLNTLLKNIKSNSEIRHYICEITMFMGFIIHSFWMHNNHIK